MVSVSAVLQVLLGAALVTLVLMHSGRDAGFGGIGFTPTSQGGTHIVERNLTRLTVAVAMLVRRSTRSCCTACSRSAAARVAPSAGGLPLSSRLHALVAELVDAPG